METGFRYNSKDAIRESHRLQMKDNCRKVGGSRPNLICELVFAINVKVRQLMLVFSQWTNDLSLNLNFKLM